MVSQFFLVFTLWLSLFFAGKSDLVADRAALLRLSSAVRGNTLRWNQTDLSPCSWEGISCDNITNRVIAIRLPGDGLSGQIPQNTIGNLTKLRTLSLRRNSLSGPLPSDLGSCTELDTLVLHENNFSGEIPTTLFTLNNLVRLDLSVNRFTGQILPDFNNLVMLTTLLLQGNQFTGSLPELNSLSSLEEFNVSFNSLNGSIPSSLSNFSSQSFLGNSLCGSPLNSCPTEGDNLSGGAIAGIVIGSFIGLLLILSIIFVLWRRHGMVQISRRVKMTPLPRSPVNPRQIKSQDPNPDIVRETNGFSGNIVRESTRKVDVIKNGGDHGMVFFGDGGFSLEELLGASAEVLGKGNTYRVYLEGGREVIVKRLKNLCVSEREFREKVEGLGVLVHENLVPLRAYYYGKEEKLLVYDCMPMGSLSSLLHGNKGRAHTPSLTWEFRIRIALEAASCINYIHSLGSNFCHGNIKSSNIFFTDYYGVRISEFGITQLISSAPTLDSNSYRAPEITDSHEVSQKADVYSFGIVLLELLTRKNPTNAFGEEGIHDLPRWVQSVVEEKWTIDVFDTELIKYQNSEEQMVQLLNLAISCTSKDVGRRPSMAGVARQLNRICKFEQQSL